MRPADEREKSMRFRTEKRNWLGLVWKAAALASAIVLVVVALGSRVDYTAEAATFNVNVGQTNGGGGNADEYNPADITITEGDTVDFAWFNGAHDVTAYAETVPGTPDWQSATMFSASTFPQTFSTVGVFTYYCTIHTDSRADAAPGVVDANITSGAQMVGKITVNAAVVDTTGPVTSSAAVAPSPTNGAASVTLTATVDDTSTGGSNVAAAEYYIDSDPGVGSGIAMAAADAPFDSATENVTVSVDVSALDPGAYTLYVRGQDGAPAGNWGATDSVVLTVSVSPPGAEDVSFTLTGGSLSLVTNPVDFGSTMISGVDQTMEDTPLDWIGTDATGTGAGWNVTVSSTDLTTTGGTITVDNLKLQLLDSAIVKVSGNTKPVSQVTSYQPLSGAALKILSAAATTGMGMYVFPPDFRLNVSAESVPGVYSAFMTVSVNSGP